MVREGERVGGIVVIFHKSLQKREREREREALGGRTEEEEASVTRKEKIPRGMYIYMVSVNYYYFPFWKGECTGFDLFCFWRQLFLLLNFYFLFKKKKLFHINKLINK